MSQKDKDDRIINQIGIFFAVVGVIFLIVIFTTDSWVKELVVGSMNQ